MFCLQVVRNLISIPGTKYVGDHRRYRWRFSTDQKLVKCLLDPLCAGGARRQVHANRTGDHPTLAINDDFGANKAIRQFLLHERALFVVGEGALAQAIPDQTAERRLAAAMRGGTGFVHRQIGRPDDVDPAPKLNIAQQGLRIAPERQPSNPQAGPLLPFGQIEFNLGWLKQIRLQGDPP